MLAVVEENCILHIYIGENESFHRSKLVPYTHVGRTQILRINMEERLHVLMLETNPAILTLETNNATLENNANNNFIQNPASDPSLTHSSILE